MVSWAEARVAIATQTARRAISRGDVMTWFPESSRVQGGPGLRNRSAMARRRRSRVILIGSCHVFLRHGVAGAGFPRAVEAATVDGTPESARPRLVRA